MDTPSNTSDFVNSASELGFTPHSAGTTVDSGLNIIAIGTPSPIGADPTLGSPKGGLKVITSLCPILQLMNINFDGTEWHFNEIDQNVNQEVLLAHIGEVKEIKIDNRELPVIPQAAYLLIAQLQQPGTHLFPNLTRLQLTDKASPSSLAHLILFVSPCLHSLQIDHISQDDIPVLEHFLRKPELQAYLKDVTLGPIPYSPRILQAISKCRSLDVLVLTFLPSKPLEYKAISLLRTSPSLRNLIIRVDHVPIDDLDLAVGTMHAAYLPAAQLQPPGTHLVGGLFPNLTRLRLTDEAQCSSLIHLTLFDSPCLRSLQIDHISQDAMPVLERFLRKPELQASLKNVTLGPIPYSPQILQAISECRSLNAVKLSLLPSKPLEYKGISLLGAIPSLQNLTIDADHVPYTPELVIQDTGFAKFATLTFIYIVGVDSFIAALLGDITADAPVYCLDLTISRDWITETSPLRPQIRFRRGKGKASNPQPPYFDTLLGLVVEQWSPHLRSFSLVIDNPINSPHETLSAECVVHLISLLKSRLERLVVSGVHLQSLDQLLQTNDGTSWPDIREIHFPMHLDQAGLRLSAVCTSTTISLSTFHHLLRRCTNLFSFYGLITLPPNLDKIFQEFDKNPIQSGLEYLVAGSLATVQHTVQGAAHMLQVARFLEKLCPNLDGFTVQGQFASDTWEQIFGIIKAFKEVRQEGLQKKQGSSGV